MARKPVPESARYELRAAPEQIRAWEAAAAREDLTLAQWIRRELDKAAKKSEAKKG